MDSYYHVHVGGYAVVELPTEMRTSQIVMCPQCENTQSRALEPFCCHCGSRFVTATKSEMVTLTLWDLMGEDDNDFQAISPDEHGGDHLILISNYTDHPDVSLDGDCMVEDLRGREEEMMKHFCIYYAPAFEKLMEKGAKITIHYGVVAYWS